MPTLSWISGARVLAAACVLVCGNSQAQTSTPPPLVDEVHTVAAATQGVPVEETFNITAAGIYQVTLTDLGAQLSPSAPLAYAQLAITSGSTVVGKPLVASAGNTSWSTTFTAQPGTYKIHVIGAPSTRTDSNGATVTVAGSGPIGIQVTNTAGGAPVAPPFVGVLAFPSTGTLNNVGVLNGTFTVQTPGSYQVTLTDMQLPTALTTLILAIFPEGGSLVPNSSIGTTAGAPTATTSVTLQPGVTYAIFAAGQAGGGVNAGLYGVNVSPAGGGTPVYSNTIPVGAVVSVGTPVLTQSNYTLNVADLAFPNALTQVGAAVTLSGLSVARLTAAGSSTPFAALATSPTSPSPYQVFAFGLPAPSSQGSYTVSLQPAGGTPVLSVARAVSDPASGVYAYSFDSTTVGSETYSLDLADFGYPASFASLKATAVQGGTQLGTGLTAAGSLNITPAAGPITLLVFAQPAPATSATTSSAGLFGIDLMANGAGAPAFETSQGVGQLFSVRTAPVMTGGSYQAVVNDLGFPASFANLAVIVTRGTSIIGKVMGSRTLPFAAIGGDYLVNFVAQPTGTAQAGTYSLLVDAVPSIQLAASNSTINSGGTVNLTWSTVNVTSCTASSSPAGAWSGSAATSGSATSPALTSATTFTLTCVSADGTTNPSQTVSVNINSGSTSGSSGGSSSGSSSKGGGGAIRWDLLVLLLGVLGLRMLGGRAMPVVRGVLGTPGTYRGRAIGVSASTCTQVRVPHHCRNYMSHESRRRGWPWDRSNRTSWKDERVKL